jgi:hypothetical protein
MKITLVGVLVLLAVGALLIYAGYELHGLLQEKTEENPGPPKMN